MATVKLTGDVVSMTGETADRLVRLGQGDAALLYVALLRAGGELPQARKALGWTAGRTDTAYAALASAGLAEGQEPPAAPAPEAPSYVTRDVLAALEGDPDFASLQRQVEGQLGSILSPADLKSLYFIYDHLALPSEVITLLAQWCVEEMERKYGTGRRPRLSQLKRVGQQWHEAGVDTLEGAEEYIRRQSALRSREAKLLPLVGIRDRAPLDKEREYLATWIDWGFAPDAITLAYQKTLMKKQSMSWPYMNSILKSWHGKGLHNAKAIQEGEGEDRKATAQPQKEAAQAKNRRVAQELADLKRLTRKEG